MAGGITQLIIAPHTPRIGVEAKAPDFQRGLIEGLRDLGAALRGPEQRPDLIVINSTHWITTFQWFVTCQVRHEGRVVAQEAPDLIPGIPYAYAGDPDFAHALVDEMARDGMAVGANETDDYVWDYGTWVPLQYMDPDGEIPVVAVGTVIMAGLDECLRAGAALRRAAETSEKKVAVLGSTALSHELVRGPEFWPTQARQDLDHRFIDLLTGGRVAEARRWLPEYARETVGEMGGRALAYALGTLGTDPDGSWSGRQYGPYAQSSGSGNASILMSPAA